MVCCFLNVYRNHFQVKFILKDYAKSTKQQQEKKLKYFLLIIKEMVVSFNILFIFPILDKSKNTFFF